MGITGSIVIGPHSIEIGNGASIQFTGNRKVRAVDPIFGAVELERATVTNSGEVQGMRGNSFKDEGPAQIYIWHRGTAELTVYLCPNQNEASPADTTSCSSYSYGHHR